MNDREKQILQMLAGVYTYYEKELSEFAIRMWLEDLSDYDSDTIAEAFARHRRDPDRGQWLPKTADILRQIRGNVEDSALVAWGSVLSAARGGGSRDGFDAVTKEALQTLGGFGAVCRANEDQNAFLQRRFVEAYQTYARRAETPPLALPVAQPLKLVKA
jgi:hypothetical protein